MWTLSSRGQISRSRVGELLAHGVPNIITSRARAPVPESEWHINKFSQMIAIVTVLSIALMSTLNCSDDGRQPKEGE